MSTSYISVCYQYNMYTYCIPYTPETSLKIRGCFHHVCKKPSYRPASIVFFRPKDPKRVETNVPLKRRNGESNDQIRQKKCKWEAEVQNHPDHQALRPILRATEHGLKKMRLKYCIPYDVQHWWWTVTKRGGASQIILISKLHHQNLFFFITQVL